MRAVGGRAASRGEQRGKQRRHGAPFILDRHGHKMQGRDDQRRTPSCARA